MLYRVGNFILDCVIPFLLVSVHYRKFEVLCGEAFNVLRRHSNLIMNALLLLVDAGIKDMSGDGKADPLESLLKVQEKFQMDLSEAEAVVHFQDLIRESVRAMFAAITDKLHEWVQYWRS